MAQLRDAKTGEWIAEGTPEEMALLAQEVGPGDVMFDDVGPAFRPAAALRAHRDRLTEARALTQATAEGSDRDRIEAHVAELEAVEERAKARKTDADRALRAARRLAKLDGP